MKYLILFILTAFVFGCNPKEKKPEPVKIERKELSIQQATDFLGAEIMKYIVDTTINKAARGKPAKTVVVVWFNDMTVSPINGGYNTTMITFPKFAGVQNFTTFQSLCNWYLPIGSQDCITISTGQIRSWATDTEDNVHVSNVISN